MDLGIEGKWALVCAASKGLGKGCAAALVSIPNRYMLTNEQESAAGALNFLKDSLLFPQDELATTMPADCNLLSMPFLSF